MENKILRLATSADLADIPSALWPSSDNNVQQKPRNFKHGSIRRKVLQTMLYAESTDFRNSEEFLDRMGELPENYHPDYVKAM